MTAIMNEKDAERLVSDILERGVGEYIDPDDVFRKKLIAKASGTYHEKIIIKFGVDPTRPDIHLGHAVILHKLRQLQDIGCTVVFLIGDYTAQIGDPTGKNKTRPEVEQSAIEANMKTYLDQVGKILRVEPEVFSWIRNSDWFLSPTDLNLPDDTKVEFDVSGQKASIPPNSFVGKAVVFEQTRMQVKMRREEIVNVSLTNFLWGLKHVTFAQLIERDMFQKRITEGGTLFMHEMLYPILQGTDSDVLARIYGTCDLEVGGTDQTFNMLMGRKIMEVNHKTPQAVLSFSLLVGLDGKEKMSKSLDNYIGITDEPADIFGKIMSIPDEMIITYFELSTFTPLETVREIAKNLAKEKVNPRDIKMDLAKQIVEIYHGKEAALLARDSFVATFQQKRIPEDIEEIRVHPNTPLADILVGKQIVPSKTEFRRLIDDGAIRENGEIKLDDPHATVVRDVVLKVGKRRFVKIVVVPE